MNIELANSFDARMFDVGDTIEINSEPQWYFKLSRLSRFVVRVAYRAVGKKLVQPRPFKIAAVSVSEDNDRITLEASHG